MCWIERDPIRLLGAELAAGQDTVFDPIVNHVAADTEMFGDGPIQQIASDHHAGFGAEPFTPEPVTFVSGIKPAVAAVAHRQAAAAAAA